MNAFAGKWIDQTGVAVTIAETNNVATVKFDNGRGPFTGFENDLYAPVISVDFTDDKPFTGVLAGSSILWSNSTVWKKG